MRMKKSIDGSRKIMNPNPFFHLGNSANDLL